MRLGHLVERFVYYELSADKNIEIIAKNIQIKKDKITIGEIDCLLKHKHTPIHLEIIYKFYLYDEAVGRTELEHWIGPNRKDSFIEKITKLKNKQFPLLYQNETEYVIDKYTLNSNTIQQQVCFKAQLFVPLNILNKPLRQINNKCIQGYYINFNELNLLKNKHFYIPSKLDWLTDVHQDVSWLDFKTATLLIKEFILQERAPLCWIKDETNKLEKIFVVWW